MLKPTTYEAEPPRIEEHGPFVPSNEKEAKLLGALHRRLEEYEMDSADATDDELEMMAPARDAHVTAEA